MTPLLEFRDVSKVFGATRALDSLHFEVEPGEIHALLGENGAGKSTALGLMYGVFLPSSGEMLFDGQKVNFSNTAAARRAGIGCVFQELSLAGGLSVAENIFAGHPPTRSGIIQRAEMRQKSREVLASLGVDIDVETSVAHLPMSLQQIVEIAKALTSGSRILLLDEPTSALAPNEVEGLRKLLTRLRSQGIGMVYVSHHIPEVFAVADRITVLRDGRRISTRKSSDFTQAGVIADMVGGRVPTAPPAQTQSGKTILQVERLVVGRGWPAFDLSLRAGEITAMAGLMGSGNQEMAAAIAGLVPAQGRLVVDGSDVPAGRSAAARAAGIWFVPEERKADGLFLDFSVAANLTAATLGRFAQRGLLRDGAMLNAAQAAAARFRIKATSIEARVSQLSGGNQQKVMLSRWLDAEPRVLVINEPTKGVDVGAKVQIHELLRSCAAEGAAVLLISSDFPEVLSLADRVVLVRNRRIDGEMKLPATVAELVAAASGLEGEAA